MSKSKLITKEERKELVSLLKMFKSPNIYRCYGD